MPAAAVRERRFLLAQLRGGAEQLIINLNQQSNNELILNLLNSSTTSQAQSNSGNALSVSA
jgi:hypothetical protein